MSLTPWNIVHGPHIRSSKFLTKVEDIVQEEFKDVRVNQNGIQENTIERFWRDSGSEAWVGANMYQAVWVSKDWVNKKD